MAYSTISNSDIEVGKPIKKELFDLIKSNLDDHETRLLALSGGSGKLSLINTDIDIGSNASGLLTGAFYIEVIQDCIATEGAIQFFAKSPATTGNLTVDIKKNTSTNPTGFTSLFTSAPTLSASSDPDFTRATGTINASTQVLNIGDILRVDVTSLPVGLQKFRLVLIGEF